MKNCTRFKQQMLDCAEDKLGTRERNRLLEHIKVCATCAREYQQIRKLFSIMADDRVPLPEQSSFDRIRAAAKRQAPRHEYETLKILSRIFVPALALAAILVITLRPTKPTVEMSIPVANLLEDDEIAGFVINGIVDKPLVQEIASMEEYLSFDCDEAIEEMTREEKRLLVNSLNKKYAIGT